MLQFYLSGIHCAACVWLLEKLPEVLPGVIDARVDLLHGTIAIRFNSAKVLPSAIAKVLSGLGYTPHPIAPDERRSLQSVDDKIFLTRLGIAAFCSMNVMLLFFGRHQGVLSGIEEPYAMLIAWVSLALSVPVVAFSAVPFYRTSWSSIRQLRPHIDIPIVIAILGGFFASAINTIRGASEIYFDSVTALVFLLLVGRWFQRRALQEVARASDLMHAMVPLQVSKIEEGGEQREVYVDSLRPTDRIAVADHASLPVDGVLLSEGATINLSILTGEASPVTVLAGEPVYAGTTNVGDPLIMAVTAVGESTRLGGILATAQSTPSRRSATADFVTKAGAAYVVGILVLATATFLYWSANGFWSAWDHAIALLIVSCPCALGIATPITLSLASARAARRGILVRNGEALERLSRVTTIAFDKTGTLTRGELEVVAVIPSKEPQQEFSRFLLSLESDLMHPIARALCRHAEQQSSRGESVQFTRRSVVPGFGIEGELVDGSVVRVGSVRWLFDGNATTSLAQSEFVSEHQAVGRTVIGLEVSGSLVSLYALGDRVRPEAESVLQTLQGRGVSTQLISGDSTPSVAAISDGMKTVPFAVVKGELTPEEKALHVEGYGERIAFVGDGANDGLALSKAGVGIGLAGGAAMTLAVSDLYLTRPDLNLVVEALDGARRTVKQVHRHLFISIVYNVIAAGFAMSGFIGPLAAALIMPLSSLSVIVSSCFWVPFSARRL
jgi:Cu2+-exporting ATPase